MRFQVRDLGHRHLYYFFLHTLVISLLFSKAGISISIGALLFLSVFRIVSFVPFRTKINKEFFKFKTYFNRHNLIYLSLISLFLLTLSSYANSENTNEWFHFIKLKAPYILIPIVFINHPKLGKNINDSIHFSLILLVSISTIFVMVNYFSNATNINESISQGKSLLTPLTHVKFSVFVAFSIISAIILSMDKPILWNKYNPKKLLIGIAFFMIIAIHVLSVRSGLLVLYGSSAALLSLYFIKSRKYLLLLLSLIVILSLPLVAYKTIPSFYNKYHYMMHDIQMIKEGKASNYSDGERFRSIQMGLDIWKDNLWTGIGIGDIRDKCTVIYDKKYPDSSKIILPHSQYILTGAAYGILGFIIFLLCLIIPLFFPYIRTSPLFLLPFILLLLYGLVEKPLDEFVFINFHCLFYCLAFKKSD